MRVSIPRTSHNKLVKFTPREKNAGCAGQPCCASAAPYLGGIQIGDIGEFFQ